MQFSQDIVNKNGFFILPIILCCNVFASKWVYQADLLNSQVIDNNEIKELSGNVIISKMILFYEQIELYYFQKMII